MGEKSMMAEWKKLFRENVLVRGKTAYQNKRVVDVTEENGTYRAAVLGRDRFEVSVKMEENGALRMKCSCVLAKSGSKCEHMAALCWALEAQAEAEKNKIDEAELMEQWRRLDEEARQENTEIKRAKRERPKAKVSAVRKTISEEQICSKEETQKKEEEQKREEEQILLAKEQQERREAREQRKAERERKKEEQRKKAEEIRQKELKRQSDEKARREKIRDEKAEKARQRAEKRKQEQELQKLVERRREEEQQKAEQMQEKMKERQKQETCGNEERQYGAEYELLGNAWEKENDSEEPGDSRSIEKLVKYSYFNGDDIRNSMVIPKQVYAQGEKLLLQRKIGLEEIASGYDRYTGEVMGKAEAVGISGKNEFKIYAFFSRRKVESFQCGCEKCRKDGSNNWFTKKTDCPYRAGVILFLQNYLNSHNLGDDTDRRGMFLLSAYQKKRVNRIMSDAAAKEESLLLVPRLLKKQGKLSVSFRIGEKRLFVIKKLDEFCSNVRTSATGVYGSDTEINHAPANFTDRGREWIHFISRIVREEEEFQQRLSESRRYYAESKGSVGSELNLFGWRLDEFYKMVRNEMVEYEDRDGAKKIKSEISCAVQNPKITMRISSAQAKGEKEFHGITVEGMLPKLYQGTDAAYYISGEKLFKVEKDFLERIEPLTGLTKEDTFSFRVGRNHMAEFYHRVLPQLEDIVEITETEPEKFRAYLPPEAHFIFYLDAQDQNVICGIHARYGGVERNVMDILDECYPSELEPFRDVSREEEILYQAMQWFPMEDRERKELHCGGEEELVYQAVEYGTQKLMELGEVRCTNRFRGYRVIRRMKVSVGVSVSSGLLELNIMTDDVPQNELLDILNSYRTKKKYYRLKDGAFLNLEDSSLEMLSELMEAAHVKPKEFVKGKMHLPLYRTLYLDKMLEENEGIYSNRDRHFKEMVKEFKTVKDADFEEPESLSKVMRKYQKYGYKWLRTLEAWQFGGILADDMGLGKTLQVISVLLAAKQEGKEGVSLVVSPASLIYNWREEFERYAPQITVGVVAGTQEMRQEIIQDYKSYDVLITSYDLLKRDILHYEEKEFAYEIIDEAQYIKNHTTAAAKAVKVIKSRVRYALTGTPIENRLSELWSIFDYLMPGFLYGYDVFKREIETPIVKNEDETAVKRLQKMVSPFILRRLKGDVLKDLPEKLEECRYVRFEDAQQKLYDGQVVHMRESIARQDDAEFNKNKMQILAELTRLRQICCDPSLCFENYRDKSAKRDACIDLIQSAMDGGHRMLVFSQFTSMLELLQQDLDELGIPYFTITGSTKKDSRLELVRKFNEGDVPVFLISLKAGGVGLNLTGADVVIHYDPWWNQAAQNQATDRAHRIGQEKKVTVYKLIMKNTIEEKIQELQESKKNLAEQIIGGETGQLGGLGREEILELLEA